MALVPKVIHATRVLINHHELPFLLLELAHVDLQMVFAQILVEIVADKALSTPLHVDRGGRQLYGGYGLKAGCCHRSLRLVGVPSHNICVVVFVPLGAYRWISSFLVLLQMLLLALSLKERLQALQRPALSVLLFLTIDSYMMVLRAIAGNVNALTSWKSRSVPILLVNVFKLSIKFESFVSSLLILQLFQPIVLNKELAVNWYEVLVVVVRLEACTHVVSLEVELVTGTRLIDVELALFIALAS